MDCLFCEIVSGAVPSDRVYEDEKSIAFMDIFPVSRGHVLLVPREHALTITALSPESLHHLFDALQKLAPAVLRVVGATSWNLAQNNGSLAGQAVGHVHVHIIPRFPNDGLALWPKIDISGEERAAIAAHIRTIV